MTTQAAIPLKWYVPFATGDSSRVEIPVTSSDATRASQTLGFPPLTMQPPAVGGVPPQGEDFNGAMNQVARVAWWVLNGGGWPYDATFATNSNIGGYPNGAVLQSADFLGQWISTADNNQNNPDTSGTNWVPGFQYGSTALTGQTGGTITLTPLQAAKRGISIAGTLTSALVVNMPTWVKDWSITNNTTGAFTVIAKTASGSGVTIPQNGSPTPVAGDGTNVTQLPQNIAAATSGTHALQLGQATGRLLRTTIYRNNGGTLQSSVDGAAFATASSTFTAQTLTTKVDAEVLGGGAAGGGAAPTASGQCAAGSGGGGGGYARAVLTTGFASATVTVGAAGVPATGAAGGSGGTSSFAGLSATGGTGGSLGTAQANTASQLLGIAAGGLGSGGIINSQGGHGLSAFYGTTPVSGNGGFSEFGAGGVQVSGTAGGTAATSYGSGGAGGSLGPSSATGAGGGAGVSGLVIIREYA